MTISPVEICNMALGNLGGGLIISLDDESKEAKLCKANYEPCRDAVLEDRDWTFASDRSLLSPLTDAPIFEWSYAFQLPADCIVVRTVSRNPRPVYTIWKREGNKVLCNFSPCYLVYTKRIEDTALMSAGFIKSLVARIAWDIAIPLTNNPTLANAMKTNYVDLLSSAGVHDGKQGVNVPVENNSLIRARFSGTVVSS